MWMQQSMEGGGQRNSYGNYGGSGYSGQNRPSNDEDWKSRIVSNGQWLGEKVMSLATRSHNSIPDNQRTTNDGRANWMAEIRNNTGSSHPSQFNTSGYNGGGYQNDFVTERPNQYTDTYRPTSYSDTKYTPEPTSSYSKSSKSNNKKHSKGKSKHDTSESDQSESSESSEEEIKPKKSTKFRSKAMEPKPEILASDEDSDAQVRSKSKKSKTKGKNNRKAALSDSDDDASTESAPEEKKKSKTKVKKSSSTSNYTYSFDPSKIAAIQEDNDNTSKKGKKKATAKKSEKKAEAAPAVDLLGVESLTISSAPQVAHAPPQPVSTIDQLAGLSFDPMDNISPGQQHPVYQSQQPLNPQQYQQFHPHHTTHASMGSNQHASQQPQHPHGFIVPGSNLVDLRLSSEVATAKANTPSETRSLNELKACTPQTMPQPSMPLPQMIPQHYPMQPGMQPGMQPVMQPGMQPGMSMQPHMAMMMMPQPHLQSMQMGHMMTPSTMGGYGYPTGNPRQHPSNMVQPQQHGYM